MSSFQFFISQLLHVLFIHFMDAQNFILLEDALPFGLGSTCAVHFNDTLLLLGGRYRWSKYDLTVAFPNISSISVHGNNATGIDKNIFVPENWTSIASSTDAYFPTQSCVQHGDLVYAIANTNIDDQHAELPENLFVYDLSRNNVIAKYSLAIPVDSPCLAMFKNSLFVIGVTVQIYNATNDSWSFGPNMHTPRFGSGCIAREEDLFVFGGQSVNGYNYLIQDSIERYYYNPYLTVDGFYSHYSVWNTQTARLSTRRAAMRCTLFKSLLYCVGGTTQYAGHISYNGVSQVDVFSADHAINGNLFDITTLEYTLNLNERRASPALISIYDHLYVFGGFQSNSNSGSPLDSMEVLSLTSSPTPLPSSSPSDPPTNIPSKVPTISPSHPPTLPKTSSPSASPTASPSPKPTNPTTAPTKSPILVVTVPIFQKEAEQSQTISFSFYIVSGCVYLGATLIIVICARRHANKNNYDFMAVSILRFLLCVLDIQADICFCINLLFLYEGSDNVILFLFIMSLIFLILPRVVGAFQMERFITRYISEYDNNNGDVRDYFGQHACKLYGCCLFTGNFRATLLLFSCNLFSLDTFKLFLNKREVILMENKAFLISLLSQDLPQLILSIIYSIHTGEFFTDIVLFVTVFGIGNMVASFFTYRAKRSILTTDYGIVYQRMDHQDAATESDTLMATKETKHKKLKSKSKTDSKPKKQSPLFKLRKSKSKNDEDEDESMIKTSKTKEFAKEKAFQAHSKLKDKLAANTDFDPNEKGLRIRTDELGQNALTGLFLVLRQDRNPKLQMDETKSFLRRRSRIIDKKWDEKFPKLMKAVWILSIIVGAGVQWTTSLILFLYLFELQREDGYAPPTTLDQDNAIRLVSAIMPCSILFVYVLGEARTAFITLQHFWAIMDPSIVLDYFLFAMFVSDLMLQLGVSALSVISIGEQDNISDQLGVSLGFFFILEFDEWVYAAFIRDFDVLNDDDFVLEMVDSIEEDDTAFYLQKAKSSLKWGILLAFGIIWCIVYFYLST